MAKRSNFVTSFKKYSPYVAVVSLLLNIGVIGVVYYMLHYNLFWLQVHVVQERCNEPGYSQMLKESERTAGDPALAKKFVAASVCFTDYQTGKPLDINSLKADNSQPALLPAAP